MNNYRPFTLLDIPESIPGATGAQASSLCADQWGGERGGDRQIRNLESELAEKDRYIKRLEMQMLASSVSKQSSVGNKENGVSREANSASAYESDITQVSAVDSPANVQSWYNIPKMIDFDKAHCSLLGEPANFSTVATSRNVQYTPESIGHEISEKTISSTHGLGDVALTSQKKEEDVYNTFILQRVLQEARAELERKNAELRVFQTAQSAATLQHEYSLLLMDIRSLSEQKCARLQERETQAVGLVSRSSSNDAPMSPISSAHWRSKAGVLEEELKQKNEAVTRLRQRELWLETQMRRQAETNVMPLDSLLSEIRALQEGSEKFSRKEIKGHFELALGSRSDQLKPMQSSSNGIVPLPHHSGKQDKGNEARSAFGMQLPMVSACSSTQSNAIVASPRNVALVEGYNPLASQQYC